MTTSSTPDPLFRNVAANPIYDNRGINTSKGERKERADLLKIIPGIDKRYTDILNQFFIAVSGGVETHENSKKTALLPGRVAVKIGTEGEEKNAKYKYIFLNLNSLSKRLGLDKKAIKDAEANGTLDEVIVKRVKELADEQAVIDEMIVGIANGRNVFIEKEYDQIPKNEHLPEKGGRAKPRLTKQQIMKKFIKEHFSNNNYLMENLEKFLTDPLNTGESKEDDTKIRDTKYLKQLVGSLWWKSSSLDDLRLGDVHEKYAISSLSDLKSPIKFVYGTAAPRADNKGTREVTRVTFFEWDKDNRYALALEDDFVYSKEPKPRSRNEVALELPNNHGVWVLVNKNTLKRLHINETHINWFVPDKDEVFAFNTLRHFVEKKIQAINDASTLIGKIKSNFERGNLMNDDDIKDVDNHMHHYPDEMFNEITADFLKKYKIKAQQGGAFDREQVTQEFRDIIYKLERHNLVRW